MSKDDGQWTCDPLPASGSDVRHIVSGEAAQTRGRKCPHDWRTLPGRDCDLSAGRGKGRELGIVRRPATATPTKSVGRTAQLAYPTNLRELVSDDDGAHVAPEHGYEVYVGSLSTWKGSQCLTPTMGSAQSSLDGETYYMKPSRRLFGPMVDRT